jgi:hypothetical protein
MSRLNRSFPGITALRAPKQMTDTALAGMNSLFDSMYSSTGIHPSGEVSSSSIAFVMRL